MNDPVFISIILIIALTGLFLSIKSFIDLQKFKKETEHMTEETDDTIRALRKTVVDLQREADASETLKELKARIDKLERPMRIAASVSANNSSEHRRVMLRPHSSMTSMTSCVMNVSSAYTISLRRKQSLNPST